jgi:hypothetical protein
VSGLAGNVVVMMGVFSRGVFVLVYLGAWIRWVYLGAFFWLVIGVFTTVFGVTDRSAGG